MHKLFRSTLASASVWLLLAAGCGDPTTPAPPACEAIVERCHALDTGGGAAHECHVYAETGGHTDAECTAMQASCFAICTTATDGGGADLGPHVHDVDAGPLEDAGPLDLGPPTPGS